MRVLFWGIKLGPPTDERAVGGPSHVDIVGIGSNLLRLRCQHLRHLRV